MKATNIIILAVSAISFLSCKSVPDSRQSGTVVRDCTGTYLRIAENRDYLVCNAEVLADKKEGANVELTFVYTKECTERDGKIMCMMYHENKGVIRVKSVK